MPTHRAEPFRSQRAVPPLLPLLLPLVLMLLLASCRPDPSPESPAGGATLAGSPTFREDSFEPEVQLWYRRLLRAATSPSQYPAAIDSARSGDLYQIGRFVNVHVSTLLAVFRKTGDLRLLDETDRMMQIARATLRDTNGDGYRNWRWLHDPGNGQWYGDDMHIMDEAMTHGLVAAVAWTYQLNRNLLSPTGIDYGERADFWKSYLLDDFEPKWREREGVTSSYDFIHVELMHPYLQLVRYFHYMGLLTGDAGYTTQAEQLTSQMADDFPEVTTERGTARVWGQGVRAANTYIGYLQPMIYAGYTTLAIYELGLEGVAPFADRIFVSQIANALVSFAFDNGADDFAVDVGGNRPIAGFDPAPLYPADPYGFTRMTDEQFAIQAFGLLAPYDDGGSLLDVVRRIYEQLEEPDDPIRIYAPAAIFLSLATSP